MDPSNIIVSCEQDTFWLYSLIWGILLPLFLAYVAAAAYTFQCRRNDIASVREALKDMRVLTMLALERTAGNTVDIVQVRHTTLDFITRFRLEALHRPEYIQKELHVIVEEFVKNADIAEGIANGTPDEIVKRMTDVESQLFHLLRQFTVIQALQQAWNNPGIKVSFNSLIERFVK